MTHFVLVHGAWHGGWCWDDVRAELRRAGHDTVAPTLTGLADRAGRLDRRTGLETHIQDVVAGTKSDDVTLVGHSYGGMVAVNAAARMAGQVRRVIVVDGFLPERGEAAIDLLPDAAAAHYRAAATAQGDGWRIPPRPLANLGVTDAKVIAAATPLLTPHPLKSYLEASPSGASELSVKGAYLLCSGWATPFRRFAERAAGLGWAVRELDGDHEVLLTAPELLAGALAEIAATVGAESGQGE
ncbi:alpha/beta fold hydrolase [Kutzneria sp. NPDC051319]|uniref:alpha/beta fold hydrolase n=1 Tax=Kutzneria sp. NPDC051319 TaxID=3155047 RepID=UPI003425E39B